ncbi:MAG: alpha/beta hydrolase fold domain-containing protein [Verrucomicrobia bacterium]|nr:alpha/beta hydrolase fold domain-containing protein [Verrucomicrobiota bacterium]
MSAIAPPGSDPRLTFAKRLLAICVTVILLASFLASRVQTSGGRVRVTGLTLPTHNGQWLTADLYRPRTATPESPAPLVVVVPGFQRSKETHLDLPIELARRGIVAIVIDPYAQGSSSSSLNPRSATNEGYGAFAVVDYAASTGNLNYIDKSRIAVAGHSAGGNAALQAASYFGAEAARTKSPSKVHSAFVSGYVLTNTERVLRSVRSNLGMSYARHDEGAYRNELKNGDMRRAPEALRFVNSGLPAAAKIDAVEIGRFYGDLATRTLRVVHNEPMLHPFQPYSPADVAHQVAFFQKIFGLEATLPAADQVWYWKEILSLCALVAAFVSLVPLARLILAHVSYFHPLVHPVPDAPPAPSGRGRLIFWTLFLTGALIACFTYIPLAELSQKLFAEAAGREATWFFPQRMNNAVVLWAFCNGLIGFALFFLGRKLNGHATTTAPGDSVASTSARELRRTALLAAVLWSAFYLQLFVVYALFHVDYRFLFVGVRVFQPALLWLIPMYAPMFFVFFLSNSVRVNAAMRFAGHPEWRSLLLAGLGNSLGLLFIIVVQYGTFATTGTVRWTDNWLYVNLLFAVVPMMFVLPYFNRFFFRMTGRIYLGPMTTCLVFIMILLSNTVCYLPL